MCLNLHKCAFLVLKVKKKKLAHFTKKINVFFSSENWSSLPEGDIIGSEEEEQEDPKDYLKGKSKSHLMLSLVNAISRLM